MSWRSAFFEAQERRTKRFFVIFPFWILLILGINVWHDAQAGKPFNVQNLLYGGAVLAFAAVVFIFSRLISRFVRAVSNRVWGG